jgi:ATP-dependent Zn protease
VAEELFLNLISTGASDDFNKATATARAMVARFGMTDALGPMVYVDDENDATPFGRGFTRTISEATQQKVDAEIRRVLDEQYNLAKRLLDENRDKVEAMTAALMEWETIGGSSAACTEELAAVGKRCIVGWQHGYRGEAGQRDRAGLIEAKSKARAGVIPHRPVLH